MKKFFIVTNPKKDPEFFVTKKILDYLKSQGCICNTSIYQEMAQFEGHKMKYTDDNVVPFGTEVVLVIGGDGTIIHAAKDLIDLKIPIVGINFGTLGYLAEIESDSIESVKSALDSIINDEFYIENRMLLKADIVRDGKVVFSDIALNDIVINRTGTMNVIDFNINVDGGFLNSYHADGVIIATPTGCTGYNLSAGGPLCQPTAEIMVLTPVCAHTLNSRSVIFSAETEIEIEILKNSKDLRIRKIVAFDADADFALSAGDRVIIKRAEESVRIIKIKSTSFVEAVGKKMR